MKLHNEDIDILVPDGAGLDAALARTTHLGIGAHQDDQEIVMIHGILECFGKADQWFTGVTCTDGSGSARTGVYADYTNEEMAAVRLGEQRAAAYVGRYSSVLQLGYSSKQVKAPGDPCLKEDLLAILRAARPQVVYTHNPADKHATHIGVVTSAIDALRELAPEERPQAVYACEAWRGLDWMPDDKKIVLPLEGHGNLVNALLGVFDSQVAGGKRYDLAAVGRYRANATFLESHAVDIAELAAYAMDLMPLVEDPSLDLVDYVHGLFDEIKAAVKAQIEAVR